ncbi:protein-tyrosine-phosphatase [Rhodococcus hoagii]|nr:protein-tyrosine-phosphatase [Prescottella equi]
MTETSATRRIPLCGTYNLRDVGGYPVGDGALRWQSLLRSDALHKVDHAGRHTLRQLGLGLVIDLREVEETESAPDALSGVGHAVVHCPIYQGSVDASTAGFSLAALYRQMITDHAKALTAAVRLIATADPSPVLVHCSAGKDRTGLVVALALAAVGADERDIVADYAVSEIMLAGEWAKTVLAKYSGMDLPEGLDLNSIVCASPAALMRETLAQIRVDHGDIQGFLRAHGMTDAEFAGLATRLVA